MSKKLALLMCLAGFVSMAALQQQSRVAVDSGKLARFKNMPIVDYDDESTLAPVKTRHDASYKIKELGPDVIEPGPKCYHRHNQLWAYF